MQHGDGIANHHDPLLTALTVRDREPPFGADVSPISTVI